MCLQCRKMRISRTKRKRRRRRAAAHFASGGAIGQLEQLSFDDNRPEAVTQRNLKKSINRSSTANVVQRKVLIGNSPYTFDSATNELKPLANNTGAKVGISNALKGRNWATDPWRRFYRNTQEVKDHIEGRPVKFGLFKELGLWYNLPFETGKPFFLGENHSTKVAPIMKESNRTGTLLSELNGTIPIGQKKIAVRPPGRGKNYKRSTMESAVAKLMYGFLKVTPAKMNPRRQRRPRPKEISRDWVKNYERSTQKGKDRIKRPWYKNRRGQKVIQGVPGTVSYDVLNTIRNVMNKFNKHIDLYIQNQSGNPAPENYTTELIRLKAEVADWWAKMQTLNHMYIAGRPAARINQQTATINAKKNVILKGLEKIYNTTYKNEMRENQAFEYQLFQGMNNLRNKDLTNIKLFSMRDFAMLTAIKEAAKDWGDHEMIVAGDQHLKTLRNPLKKALPSLLLIPRSKFISQYSKNALP